MSKETPQPQPFSLTTNGREYFLCVKQEHEKNVYFFTTQTTGLREGQKQAILPSGYEVSTERGMPALVKKS